MNQEDIKKRKVLRKTESFERIRSQIVQVSDENEPEIRLEISETCREKQLTNPSEQEHLQAISNSS